MFKPFKSLEASHLGNSRVTEIPQLRHERPPMGNKCVFKWSYIPCEVNIFLGVLVREWSVPLAC